ncbi:uncharacterized protein L3040_004501 [Drepanopeziza brunnea f. sp. 'multigermtubi']|uniref:Protein kinase domain-containing protein n=1 Tax=Marssonina brunnea f. sp. multigermtubi (strain MB_m1) TaxID=1072389 RepID=K1WZ97_MARBU|nr:uncharacterized protein MBM_03734 [Drepanopeziza brunnea f. sp. 'multigermtubi' MB_m1]EKD17962.1 hypothetical protein MBM_03734 [Drepanopeziza brunnea f. sp. 'multigermtubi' MB_m1]KAJ5043116.1 hypothetical protein L3040_004501 [Drepanopeziza brunnea f. sp. 'multigermtubi']
MQSVQTGEIWCLDNEVPSFLHSTIVFQRDGVHFVCQSEERKPKLDIESINALHPRMIPREDICPLVEENLTVCEEPTKPDIFIKRPDLTSYDGSSNLADFILQEARICEILMRHPHPHIVKYFGCYVEEGRIAGLCFQRYAETAEDRMLSGRPIDKDKVYAQISDAVEHLHSIHVAHRDIKTANVMFPTESSDFAILIDFDASAVIGQPHPAKRGLSDEQGLEKLAKSLAR